MEKFKIGEQWRFSSECGEPPLRCCGFAVTKQTLRPCVFQAYQASYGVPSPGGGGGAMQSPSTLPSSNQASGAQAASQAVAAAPAYDPLAPVDVNRMNAAVMERHQPALTGGFLRQPS